MRKIATAVALTSLFAGVTAGSASADSGAYTDGSVKAIAYDGSGGFYIGGSFANVKGASQAYIAHIKADATLDTSFAPVLNGSVNSIDVSGSTVYFGGTFTSVNSTTRNRVAAVDTSGTLQSFNPNANGSVDTIKVSGGLAYIGGLFTTLNGTTRNYAGAWNTSTNALNSWNPNVYGASATEINDIEIYDSKAFLCGNFEKIGGSTGTARTDFASVDPSTAAVNTSFNVSTNGDCRAMATGLVGTTKTVFFGGLFSGTNSLSGTANATRNYAAAVSSTGTIQNWNPNIGITGGGTASVEALAYNPTTQNVFVGGNFTTVRNTSRTNIAALSAVATASTTTLVDLNSGAASSYKNPDPNGMVRALYAVDGIGLAAGGDFTVSALVSQNYYSGPQLSQVRLQVGGNDTNAGVKISKGDQVKGVGYGFYDAGGNITSLYRWQRCTTLNDTSSCQDLNTGQDASTMSRITGAWYGTTNNDIGYQVRLRVYWNTVNSTIQKITAMTGIVTVVASTLPELDQAWGSFGVDADSNAYTEPHVGTEIKPFINTAQGKWQGYIAGVSTLEAQWQSCTDASDPGVFTSCTNIPAAQGGTNYWYRPRAADVGKGLRIVLTLRTRTESDTKGSLITPVTVS